MTEVFYFSSRRDERRKQMIILIRRLMKSARVVKGPVIEKNCCEGRFSRYRGRA